MDVRPYKFVEKGGRIAHIVNLFGDIIEEIKAPKNIYSIGVRCDTVVNGGDRIAFAGSIN